jgi:hypothetical protein
MAEPKSGRGGYRAGAGRKKSLPPIAKPADKNVAAEVLRRVQDADRWVSLIEFTAPDNLESFARTDQHGIVHPVSARDAAAILMVHMNSLRTMHEQVHGKAKQAIDLTGEIVMETLAERLAKARQRRNGDG